MKYFIALILSCCLVNEASAQAHDKLLYFYCSRMGNQVQLNFSIKAGNTCNGIQIYRSGDSLNFSEIGDIQGICGSSDRDEAYSFTDENPGLNQTNYYRLQLGVFGFTDVVQVFFADFSANPYLVYPNPLTADSKIYVNGSIQELLTLNVYSPSGRHCYQKEYFQNYVDVSAEEFHSGIYYFTVFSTNRKVLICSGSLIVM